MTCNIDTSQSDQVHPPQADSDWVYWTTLINYFIKDILYHTVHLISNNNFYYYGHLQHCLRSMAYPPVREVHIPLYLSLC